MAKLTAGILGGIKGKVGTVVGGSWKGIDWIRIYKIPTYTRTTEQGVIRDDFKLLIAKARFSKVEIVNYGFGKKVQGKPLSPTNAFMKANMEVKDWKVTYGDMKFSDGILAEVNIESISINNGTGEAIPVWEADRPGYTTPSDKFILFMGYPSDPLPNMFVLAGDNELVSGKLSTCGTGMYKILSSGKAGESATAFMFAVNDDGEVSNTRAIIPTFFTP